MTEGRESSGMRYGAIERADAIERGALVAGGRYRVGGVLGRGGMAMVYAATRVADGLDVALKVAAGPYADRPDLAVRMQNEHGFAAELAGHPNLVRPLDGGRLAEVGGVPYLVTELVRGPALTDLIVMQRQLAPLRATSIALDVARALAALHERGIVHRDVKPDNIVIAKSAGGQQQAKLIDFGLAARVDTGEPMSPRLTAVFERPGTKHYMAPEQALGAKPATSFDVYALGVTLFEMLIGTPPFGERSADEAVARKLAGDLPSFSIVGLREDLPDALVQVVDGCLLRDPARRIETAALVETLARAVEILRRERPSGTDSDPGSVDAAFEVRASALVDHASVVAAPAEAGRLPRWSVVVAGMMAIALLGAWAAGVFRGEAGNARATGTEDAGAEVGAVPAAVAPLPSPEVGPEPRSEQRPAPIEGEPRVLPSPPEPAVAAPDDSKRDVAPRITRSLNPEPAAAAPQWQSDHCRDVRARAPAAVDRDPAAALEILAETTCWQDRPAHRRLRVRALSESGRYAECVRAGQASKDPEVISTVEFCRAKAK